MKPPAEAGTTPTLYLIPNLLGETEIDVALPRHIASVVSQLTHFLVEDERSARRLIKQLVPSAQLRELHIEKLDEHTRPEQFDALLAPLRCGQNMGVISEAGCPAIADPGAEIVRRAHSIGVRVVPLVGPCSMVLALMASGLCGQRWRFVGYIPVETEKREATILELERESLKNGETQIMMDTPYRNQKLLADILRLCKPDTDLCVAQGVTTPQEMIKTASIAAWRSNPIDLGKIPSLFLLGRGQ